MGTTIVNPCQSTSIVSIRLAQVFSEVGFSSSQNLSICCLYIFKRSEM